MRYLFYYLLGALLLAPLPALGQAGGGYDLIEEFEADRFEGTLDGAIERLVGNVDLRLASSEEDRPPMRVRADEVRFDYGDGDAGGEPQRVHLIGSVRIEHEFGNVRASEGVMDLARGEIVFTGNPEMESEYGAMQGSQMTLDLETNKFHVEQPRAQNVAFGARRAEVRDEGPLLTEADVRDWADLIRRLQDEGAAEEPSPARRMMTQLNGESRELLMQLDPDALTDAHISGMLEQLNGLLRQRELYSEEAWAGITIPNAGQELLAQDRGELETSEVVRLNRILLRAAYPQHFASVE
ncbi:MAG: hypothetical protein R6W89_04905 [Candidatus Hydrogenedentota bacterium]